jgi:CheY-like chemotaxis protein
MELRCHDRFFWRRSTGAARNHTERIDILITDIDMGRMSGIELYRHIRDERPETAVPFISASAYRRRIAARLPGVTEAIHAPAVVAKVAEALSMPKSVAQRG